MRHRVFGRKLNRDIKERKALFRSLARSLILNGKIKTTSAKAKAIASLMEKLVTKAKDGSRQSLIQIMSFLNKKEPIKKLTDEIAPLFKDKMGGFIRTIKLGRRSGDNAEEVLMEWTVKPEPKKIKPQRDPAKGGTEKKQTAKKEEKVIKKELNTKVKTKSKIKAK